MILLKNHGSATQWIDDYKKTVKVIHLLKIYELEKSSFGIFHRISITHPYVKTIPLPMLTEGTIYIFRFSQRKEDYDFLYKHIIE